MRYRYRTPALTGRWRDTRQAAAEDAVRAKQATADPRAADGLHWLVPGEIEAEESEAQRAAAAGR